VREQVEPELEVAVNVTCSQLQVQLCELRELGRTQPLCEAFAVVTVGQSGCKPALAHQQTQHVGGERTHDAGRVSSAEPGLPQAGKRGLSQPHQTRGDILPGEREHRAPWVRGGGLAEGPEQRPRLIRRACARQGSPRDAGHHLVGDAVKQRARGGNVAVQRYQAATQLGGQALHRDCCDAFGFDELDRRGDDAFA
jgi:hypothetical protein